MDLVDEHDKLLGEYNESLDHYKNVVKTNHEILGPKYGDWNIVVPRVVDPNILVEVIGEDECLSRGLVEKKFGIRRQTYEDQVKKGLINKSVSEQAEKDGSITLRGPKPAGIYQR
jgi:hypothetical protein